MAVPAADPQIRPASTVLVLRPCRRGFEVLMVRRVGSAAFMGGAHVFPGGALDDIDRGPLAAGAVRWGGDPEELPWRAAALRELAEEAGVLLTEPAGVRVPGKGAELYRGLAAAGAAFDADRLTYLSNWVTPRPAPRRFDTRFYVAVVPGATGSSADGREVMEAAWVAPAEALHRGDRGEWKVELPTRKHLELLAGCADAGEVVKRAALSPRVEKVEPRAVIHRDGTYTVLLPGDRGYEEAPA